MIELQNLIDMTTTKIKEKEKELEKLNKKYKEIGGRNLSL